MKININGCAKEVVAPMLDLAMVELGFGDKVVAVALNGEFVSQLDWSTTDLYHGDALEVIAPMQGG